MSFAVLRQEDKNEIDDQFGRDVIAGLSQESKTLHPKYFYDKKGSEYFDQICQLEEYYPYKTELALLPKVAKSLGNVLNENYSLVEFGAGSLLKVKPLLDEVAGIDQFVPIDISSEHLEIACEELAGEYKKLDIQPVSADFTQTIELPLQDKLKPLGFFPGSTIGNFTPSEAKDFLINVQNTLGAGSYFLVGVDTKKSPDILHKAYNDAKGVTADFNLNILKRINARFGNVVDLSKFEHYAFYNAHKGCIEMHLVCLEEHSVALDEIEIHFDSGETIHTESSYKYSSKDFQRLAHSAGWAIESSWFANNDMFSVYLLKSDS